MFNWLKNLFKSDSKSEKQESYNYFHLSYFANLCGIGDSSVLKTTESLDCVEDKWYECANEVALDYVHEDDLEDLEIYAEVIEISEEEYLLLKSHHVEDWVI